AACGGRSRLRLFGPARPAIAWPRSRIPRGAAMLLPDRLYLGASTRPEYLIHKYGNRHGLITGATGTGKTVTLQVLAEGFSAAGVPVFAADIKGDLSGIAQQGEPQDWQVRRAAEIGFDDYAPGRAPVIFW